MSKSYIFKRMGCTTIDATKITVQDGDISYPLKHIVKHSPDGMNWGYGGSGPSDTALSVLTDASDAKIAFTYYQKFKREFIVNMPIYGGSITIEAIQDWIKQQARMTQYIIKNLRENLL